MPSQGRENDPLTPTVSPGSATVGFTSTIAPAGGAATPRTSAPSAAATATAPADRDLEDTAAHPTRVKNDGIRATLRAMSTRTRVGALAVATWVALMGVPAASAAGGGSVHVSATIDGRDVANAGDGDPIRLDPGHTPNVVVRVTNDSTAAVPVRSVRLEGRAFGISFVSLENRIDHTVAPGVTAELRFPLETSPVHGQAIGLLRASITVLGDDHRAVADTTFVADVRGSVWSIEGVFGLGALLFTSFSVVLGLLDVARDRMSPSRWWRAARFAVPGATFGVAFTFLLAAIRLTSPRAVVWVPLVVLGAAAGFAGGWRTPGPEPESIDLDALERERPDVIEREAAPAMTGDQPAVIDLDEPVPAPATPAPAIATPAPAPTSGRPTPGRPRPGAPAPAPGPATPGMTAPAAADAEAPPARTDREVAPITEIVLDAPGGRDEAHEPVSRVNGVREPGRPTDDTADQPGSPR
jgi:hypothetical protein